MMVGKEARNGNKIVMKLFRYFWNMAFEDFCDAFDTALEQATSEAYKQENWTKMKQDFVFWYCNLDKEVQERFVQMALYKYGKEENEL